LRNPCCIKAKVTDTPPDSEAASDERSSEASSGVSSPSADADAQAVSPANSPAAGDEGSSDASSEVRAPDADTDAQTHPPMTSPEGPASGGAGTHAPAADADDFTPQSGEQRPGRLVYHRYWAWECPTTERVYHSDSRSDWTPSAHA